VDGFPGERLQLIVEVALARLEEMQKMNNSMEDAQMRLAEGKLIKRAIREQHEKPQPG
jgi:AmiR/NasT family two-component response regulator